MRCERDLVSRGVVQFVMKPVVMGSLDHILDSDLWILFSNFFMFMFHVNNQTLQHIYFMQTFLTFQIRQNYNAGLRPNQEKQKLVRLPS